MFRFTIITITLSSPSPSTPKSGSPTAVAKSMVAVESPQTSLSPIPRLDPAEDSLAQHSAFFNFSKSYLGVHKTIPKDFEVTDAVLDEFKQFLAKEKIPVSDKDYTANLDFIKNRIHIQLVGAIFGENEADRISIGADPLVLKSLDSMPQAKELMAKAKRYIASQIAKVKLLSSPGQFPGLDVRNCRKLASVVTLSLKILDQVKTRR